jgi:hypothetical protein
MLGYGIKSTRKLCMAVHTYNPRYSGAEIEITVHGPPRKKGDSILINKLGVIVHACHS